MRYKNILLTYRHTCGNTDKTDEQIQTTTTYNVPHGTMCHMVQCATWYNVPHGKDLLTDLITQHVVVAPLQHTTSNVTSILHKSAVRK